MSSVHHTNAGPKRCISSEIEASTIVAGRDRPRVFFREMDKMWPALFTRDGSVYARHKQWLVVLGRSCRARDLDLVKTPVQNFLRILVLRRKAVLPMHNHAQ